MSKVFKLNMSREALQQRVDRSGRRVKPVAASVTKPEPQEDEVFVLNDYEVYIEVGGMQVFVDPKFHSHFFIDSSEKMLELWHSVSIQEREFIFNKKKKFRFGKPSKEYKEFLKRGESIALELPIIYGAKLLELKGMSVEELVYTDFLRDRPACTALVGRCFNHRELPNGVPIVVGNIESATIEVVCGAEVIIVKTIDGVEYILLDSLEEGMSDFLKEASSDFFYDDDVEEKEVFDAAEEEH